ncbi:MAG: hypothetical protein KOO66_05255 [Bacteroidales bacterium]|nr:hypothetical protein [Bacteroidales bacterium]
MKIKLLIFLSLLGTRTIGQEFPQTITKDSLFENISAEYAILDSAYGNLNRDEYPDLLIVFKKNNESEISDVIDNVVDRPLLIYLGKPDGKFSFVARNDKAVLCYDCGGIWGDPYEGLAIKNGYFTIEHYGGSAWRWSRYITFKYSEKDSKWYLHKDGGDSYHNSDPENVETNIKTVDDFGIIEFEVFEY